MTDRKGLYGDEAINTIVQEMENHRDDMIVIFAGYQKEMKELEDCPFYFEYELGMGYLLVFEQFKESPIILDFYAKKMIDGIFEEYNIHLDAKLHEDFSCPEELYRLGINNYLLRFIGDYDSMLANYLSVNLDLLDDLKKVNGVGDATIADIKAASKIFYEGL